MAEEMICVSVYESGINCIHRSPQWLGHSLCTMNGEMALNSEQGLFRFLEDNK